MSAHHSFDPNGRRLRHHRIASSIIASPSPKKREEGYHGVYCSIMLDSDRAWTTQQTDGRTDGQNAQCVNVSARFLPGEKEKEKHEQGNLWKTSSADSVDSTGVA
ncbi:hypothetical protein CVT25_005497 [Psilocybe cyanescens]|uniref:Uncharacterized protein n=1 Tax=Psilocybe cyanescens TaxID=93625 RepID=A0A409VZY0_PSICY|nr:hypothetical protein CVT25_005497 [Psilocybe cyanescens]